MYVLNHQSLDIHLLYLVVYVVFIKKIIQVGSLDYSQKLNEKGHHPTLIYPRPINKTSYEKDGLFYFSQYKMSDAEMHTYLNSKKLDEIFEELNHISRV